MLPNGLPHSRFGFVVSGRVGKAVVRNRVRRRLREAIRRRLAQIEKGYDVVIIARPEVAVTSHDKLVEALDGLLRRAGVLANKQ